MKELPDWRHAPRPADTVTVKKLMPVGEFFRKGNMIDPQEGVQTEPSGLSFKLPWLPLWIHIGVFMCASNWGERGYSITFGIQTGKRPKDWLVYGE